MILGQAVEIVAVIKLPAGVTLGEKTITITDPDGTTVVDAADFENEYSSGRNVVLSYVYSSDEEGVEGNYDVTVNLLSSDGKPDVRKSTFRLNSRDNE